MINTGFLGFVSWWKQEHRSREKSIKKSKWDSSKKKKMWKSNWEKSRKNTYTEEENKINSTSKQGTNQDKDEEEDRPSK